MYYKNTTPNSGYTVPLGYVGIAARQMYRHGKAYDVSRLHRKIIGARSGQRIRQQLAIATSESRKAPSVDD